LSAQAYWCLGIPKDIVVAAISNSLCLDLYKKEGESLIQIGFTRVVTDAATFAWLCDFYLEETYRGLGLSKWLLECVVSCSNQKHLRRFCLATKDEHALYEKFGFQVTQTPGNWMEIKDNHLYKKMAAEQQASLAVLDAVQYGVDLNLLEGNLTLSPQARLERHESALELVNELRKAGDLLYKI